MEYAKEFFDLQLRVAEKISDITGLTLQNTITNYTAFYLWFDLGSGLDPFNWDHPAWQRYISGITQDRDIEDWTYQNYLLNQRQKQSSVAGKQWGCFSYRYHKGDRTIIRPHFAHRDNSGQGPLSSQRKSARIDELSAMFTDISLTTPEAKLVRGETWLYNRTEYKRLFPAAYGESARMVEPGFQYRAIWGQFVRSDGQIQAQMVSTFLENLVALQNVQDLGKCFPYQILRTECEVDAFYRFYAIEDRPIASG